MAPIFLPKFISPAPPHHGLQGLVAVGAERVVPLRALLGGERVEGSDLASQRRAAPARPRPVRLAVVAVRLPDLDSALRAAVGSVVLDPTRPSSVLGHLAGHVGAFLDSLDPLYVG